jgi:hypothetical protein
VRRFKQSAAACNLLQECNMFMSLAWWSSGNYTAFIRDRFRARTMTRGVNKVAKEDLKQSMERQVSRSHENVNNLIRLFLVDEAELLKQSLST